MPLPPYYLKVILTSRLACVIAMMMYKGGILQVLFASFSKDPGDISYVFIITGKVTTLEPINGPTFADHGVFVLGEDQQVLDIATTFEEGLYAIPPTDLCDAFTETLCIRYNYIALGFNFIYSNLGICSALVVSLIIDLTGGSFKPFLHLVQSLFWVFTLGVCLPEMIHFFAEKFRIATHCFGPMGEGISYTKFCWEVVVAVPLLVLVHVRRFPVYNNGQITISLWFNNCVQEGDGTILLVVLHYKLDGRVNTVDVL